jgi:hypothetical protein
MDEATIAANKRIGRLVVESWVQHDALGLLQQLGVVRALPGM